MMSGGWEHVYEEGEPSFLSQHKQQHCFLCKGGDVWGRYKVKFPGVSVSLSPAVKGYKAVGPGSVLQSSGLMDFCDVATAWLLSAIHSTSLGTARILPHSACVSKAHLKSAQLDCN